MPSVEVEAARTRDATWSSAADMISVGIKLNAYADYLLLHAPTLDGLRDAYIVEMIKACGGNKTTAAKLLGVDRRTLYRMLDRIKEREDGRSKP